MPELSRLPLADHIASGDYTVTIQGGVAKQTKYFLGSAAPPVPGTLSFALSVSSTYKFTFVQMRVDTPFSGASYSWDFGDGNPHSQYALGSVLNYYYFSSGDFTITLTRNYNGVIDIVTKPIHINPDNIFSGTSGLFIESLLQASRDTNIFTTGINRNPNVWTGSADLTFKGIDGGYSLITPSHVIYATHVGYGIGTVCSFADNSGNTRSATISSVLDINSQLEDISIGALNAPIHVSVTPVKLAHPNLFANYFKSVINTVQNEIPIPVCVLPFNPGRVARTALMFQPAILNFNSWPASFASYWPNAASIQYQAITGDSSSPILLLTPQGFQLLTSYHLATSGTLYANYLTQIEAFTGVLPVPDLSSYPLIYP